jgi:protein O-GlcNAc transferase
MDFHKFAGLLPAEYYNWGGVNAYPKHPTRYIDALDKIQAMTTPSNMHLLNLAVQCLGVGECYLEVGTWRGSTLIGALMGNQAEGYAIDNDTMDEHDKDKRSSQVVWRENVARFGLATRTHYIDASVPAVWSALDVPPVGVYLFDGDKATEEAAYAGLWGVTPYLAEQAIILVDDANDINIRRAVWRFEKELFGHAIKFLDIPTPGNCWPCFWNGVLAIAWHA